MCAIHVSVRVVPVHGALNHGNCAYLSSSLLLSLCNLHGSLEAIAIKYVKEAASDMRMHHVLMILTLNFIQGHRDLYHENNRSAAHNPVY